MGLTQREAGKKIGSTKDTIHNWETGKTLIPTVKLLFLFAQLCGVDVLWLYGEEGNGPTEDGANQRSERQADLKG